MEQLITQKITDNANKEYSKVVFDAQLLPLAIDLTMQGKNTFARNLDKTKELITKEGFTVLSWCN
jgi:hypothetical protein